VKLGPPNVHINAYGNHRVENLGSFVHFIHTRDRRQPVICEVCDTKAFFILGKMDSIQNGYVQFPEIDKPDTSKTPVKQLTDGEVHAVMTKSDRSTEMSIQAKSDRRTDGSKQIADPRWAAPKPPTKAQSKPVAVTVSRPSHNTVVIDGKEHSVPTTAEYIKTEFADVFKGTGRFPGPKYHIELNPDATPVQHKPRQVPHSIREAYKKKLDEMVANGIITPVTEYTPWVNSIVTVKKADGSLRICLDPKDLNKALSRNQHYTRTVDEVLPELKDSEFFSLFDANSGYWHIELDLESSLITTFNTPWGRFRWLRLPFGLTVSSDAFQERLDPILATIPGCTGIADDILVYGKTKEEHDTIVLHLMETARRNCIKFNSEKMQYRSEDIKFFGHRVTNRGLKADPEKVKAITQMPPLKDVAEVETFLGMVGYLHRHSASLTRLAVPLRELTQKGTVFLWQPQHQRAFDDIKDEICNLPVLAYYDADREKIIQCDASKKGLGAVLLQDQRPVMFVSRALASHEQNYSNIEREFLSVKFALQKMREYIWGYDCVVQTDHQPLVSI
jgi:hypothetical protein